MAIDWSMHSNVNSNVRNLALNLITEVQKMFQMKAYFLLNKEKDSFVQAFNILNVLFM